MTTARERLDLALLDLAARGRRPRCAEPADHHLWTSDDHDERARAARLCAGCPLLHPCAESAEDEHDRWTTRGGTDRRARARAETTRKASR